MVEDFKGYRIKKNERSTSPGWSILIFSHMAILVVGISLGYWIGGRFAAVSTGEKTVTRPVDTAEDQLPETVAQPEKEKSKEHIGKEDVEKESSRAPNQPEEKPQFTFYESLSKKTIPDAQVPTKQEGAEKADPSDERSQKGSGTEDRPRRSTRETSPVVYYVQVASFQAMERAGRLRDDLKEKGYSAEVARKDLKDKGVWYRVRLGPFGDKASANREAQTVSDRENLRPIIVRETNTQGP